MARNSRVWRISLTYDREPPTSAPRNVVLKEKRDHQGAREVLAYREAAALPDRPPVLVRCHGTGYDPETGNSRLDSPTCGHSTSGPGSNHGRT